MKTKTHVLTAMVAIFCLIGGTATAWGQIAAWDFTGAGTTSLPTYAATTFDAHLVSTSGANNITRGAAASWSNASNSFRTTGFKNEGISSSNTDYFQITLTAVSGYAVSLLTIDAKYSGTQTFVGSSGVTSQFAYSVDGTNFTLISSSFNLSGSVPLTMAQIDLSGITALQNVAAGTTITIRYYASGQTTTGGWGFYSSTSGQNGLTIGGTVTNSSAPVISTVGTLSSFGNIIVGNHSAEQSYTISGTNLTDDIIVTSPTDFEISQTSGSGFSTNPITLTQAGGIVSTTTIYVRFSPLNTGVKSVNITNASTGAITQNIALSGTGININTSDIIENTGFTYPTNIAYENYQATDIVGGSSDIEIAQFTIRDGGASAERDSFGTILNSITFNITNFSFIRRIALYDGATEVGTEAAGASSVTFSGFAISAVDGGTKDFSIRVSLNTTVTDNQKIQLTVSGAAADLTGSLFATSNAGGAASSIIGDNNKIEVTATRLVNTTNKPPASVYINVPFIVEIKATDINNNTDLDAVHSITLTRTTGTGTLTSATSLTQSMSSGVYSWSDVAYNTVESFVITAAASGLTSAVSGSISCLNIPVANHVVIAEIYGGGGNSGAPYTNDYIVLYNPTISSIDLTGWSVQYNSAASTTTTWQVTNLSGSILANSYYLIQEGTGGAVGTVLPHTPIVTGSINMNGTAGKVVLSNSTTAFTVQAPSGSSVIDFVGYGSSANAYEGTGYAYAPSNTSSIRRKSNAGTNVYGSANGYDGDDNSLDFYVESNLTANSPLPVELISFAAVAQKMSAQLKWITATETDNYGFEIERREIGENGWQKVGFVRGAGTSNSVHAYTYADSNLSSGKYAYRLKQIDNGGACKYSSSTELEMSMPKELKLFGNFPNPFNPSTKVQFTVPVNGNVRLCVYNVVGQEVMTLFDGVAKAGKLYETTFNASCMATGLYFCVLEFGNQRITHKMLMTK
ncbi:MAG: lamin tail domain-containing protein [Ignavibacteriales bacterium]|nr:lamin tail domain-containing protein [Ignavibacteriales bacterium]